MMEVLFIGLFPIGGKREKEAFSLLRRNAEEVLDVVKKFEEVIIALFSERDMVKAEALGRKLSEIETNADKGRRKFTAALQQGAFLPTFRGDLAGLAEKLDDVADAAEEAMRAILLREKLIHVLARAEKKRRSAKVIREGLIKMAGLATKTVESLRNAVNAMTSDIDAANEKANEVEELEHESDILEQSLLNDLYEHEKLFDPVSIAQLKEIIGRIGSISDRAEDTSDMIPIVGYRFRP
jgi:predicted phosphate transport protein (TIGR00153 family)